MDFFDNPFADFDSFFGESPSDETREKDTSRDTGLIPSWTDAFGSVTPLSRLSRGLGQSFNEAFRHIEEMSKEPEKHKNSRCFCSATSEVLLPNGAHEVRHTSRDSQTGREVSLHTREVDGKRVTERREKDLCTGREERRRDLLNVDEPGLAGFDAHWNALCPPSGSSSGSDTKALPAANTPSKQ